MVMPLVRFIRSVRGGSLDRTRLAYLVSLLLCSTVTADRGSKLMEFYAVLDSCYSRKDVPCLIRLAARTEGNDLWAMGRGLGPTNAASLRIEALELRAKSMFDELGLLRNEVVSALEGSLSERERELLTQLATDPADPAQMLQLLTSEDPSVRWIGIYKARFLAKSAAPIVQKLRTIAASDDFVLLDERAVGATPVPEGGRGETRLEFVAPLRTLANKRLSKWTETVAEDPGDVARTGLRRLVNDYLAEPTRELEILGAVERFHPEYSPLAHAELDRFAPQNADERRVIEAFKSAIRARRER